jgi:thiamine biosynthesis lipoprotein
MSSIDLGRRHGTDRRVEHVMGMPISLALRGRYAYEDRAELAWQEALATLRDVDRVFSTYRPDSAISRLGRGEIDEVLTIAETARRESGGAFDVRRADAGGASTLDPSGVVKGWAVDRAARAFDALEETDFCLSAGGDLVCRTRLPGSDGWRIGVEDPHAPRRTVAVIPVRNGAVATSGLAHRGPHIVDPRTGEVPAALASVTVVGPDLTWVDIEATVGLVLGDQAGPWLSARPGRSGLIVHSDGRTQTFGSTGAPT